MIKKEFVSYWTAEYVGADVHKMPIQRAQFFNESTKVNSGRQIEIVIPENVRYDDLAVFVGRKTKITIETLD